MTLFYKKAYQCACIGLILAIFWPVSGCSARKPALRKETAKEEKAAKSGSNYPEVLNRWTRGAKVLVGLELRLNFNATYKDIAFRTSYIDRYASSYQLDDAYKKILMEKETDQAEQYNEFFFTAFTPEDAWNDFDSRTSVWRLYLLDNLGNRLTPISIKKADKSDPLIRELFPYFDPWSQGYIVKFPKYSEAGKEPIPGKDTKSLKLEVTGILGRGEVEWRLKD